MPGWDNAAAFFHRSSSPLWRWRVTTADADDDAALAA